LNEDALRNLIKENGGALRTFNNKVEEGIRKVHIDASFPDAQKMLSQTTQGMIAIKQEGDLYTWQFLDSDMTASYENLDDEVLAQQLAFLAPSLTGLKFALDIEVPKLVETNLNKVGANTCRLSLDFDKDIAGKTGQEQIKAFRSLLTPKWVKFKVK